MADNITVKGMQARAQRFIRCQTFEELARLLRKAPMALMSLAMAPTYREFQIPKKKGGFRQIEDPLPPLKKVQRRLNDYLQAVYYAHRTRGAYGFLTNPTDDPQPRNILTNARRHIGCRWMLNVDMQDFFHLIDHARVKELFRAPLLDFNDHMSTALSGLCCYKGRLPMGAPTSPILSNVASIPLDHDLQDYADDRGWTYTRYADDITFSAQTEINAQHIAEINHWIKAYDLRLNPSKIRLYSPDDEEKEVTGLRIGTTDVTLTDDYLDMLECAIEKLNDIIDAKHTVPSGKAQQTPWVQELEQKIKGKLEFARLVLPEDDDRLINLEMRFDQAVEPPEVYGPLTWLEFGYSLFK